MWELHTDGALSEEGVGAGLVLTSPEGEEHTYELKFCFYESNNEAKYEQVNETFEAKDISMRRYFQLVEKISKNFETLKVVQISRNKNKKADVLRKLAALTFDHLHKKILVEVLKDKSIDEKVVVATVEEGGSCWMTSYVTYLQDGTLPGDVTEAIQIKVSAPLYVLEDGMLYRKSFNGPNLRCLTPQKAVDMVKEMHEDFFTKWVEAKVLALITGENIKKFVWNDIVCRYGLPNEIVSDNANGEVEVTNNEIVAGIKARLGLSQTKWVDEVPYVLWNHRTMPKRSTGETSFSLVYGTEAVIPAEIHVPTQRVLAFDIESNSSVLRENLNLLEQRRIMAAICQADAKHQMVKYYNKQVRHVQFKKGNSC
ncbi:uncharacterized protein [Rutidosis leptorrhynchoides]|uniref:uncharacterized protein n=1 Tax=Rutidosis leptorrhynchoides TaxID=125765 RepID=UPI003A992E79